MDDFDNDFEEPEGLLRWNFREEKETPEPVEVIEPSDFDFYVYVP